MPWSLYNVSVQENPRRETIAIRLSLRPVKSEGAVTLNRSAACCYQEPSRRGGHYCVSQLMLLKT